MSCASVLFGREVYSRSLWMVSLLAILFINDHITKYIIMILPLRASTSNTDLFNEIIGSLARGRQRQAATGLSVRR